MSIMARKPDEPGDGPPPDRPESMRGSKIDQLRVPPQSVDSEQSVLGGLMLDPNRLARVKLVLTEEDFYRRDHRLIYRSILALAEKSKPFDSVTMGEYLEAHMLADQVGGTGYLIELSSNTPSAANILAYAEIVREKSLLRQAIEVGTSIVNGGFKPEGRDAGEVLAESQSALARLVQHTQHGDLMRPADLGVLMGQQIRAPRFVVDPYLPRGVVTLLGSHGGAGKTTLAEIAAAHVAAGKWLFGSRVETGRVDIFSFEDDAEKVAYKTQRIVDVYGLDADKVRANLRVYDWSQGDTALATEFSDMGVRRLQPTPLFARLEAAAKGAALVIIDNASDTYDGDENNRRQVGAFMRLLKGIAQANDCAVLLLAHLDKNAARFGAANNSYSGSTAWHNAARSRLALIDKDDAIELRQEKLNVGRLAEPFRLRWAEHGVLVPIGDGAAHDGATTTNEGQDAAGVLAAIRAAAAAGTDVRTARSGPGNTHQLLATFGALPSRLKSAKGKDDFWTALDYLVSSGRVEIVERYTSGRNLRRFLVEAGTVPSLFNTPTPPVVGTNETNEGDVGSSNTDNQRNQRNQRNSQAGRDYRSKQAGDKTP